MSEFLPEDGMTEMELNAAGVCIETVISPYIVSIKYPSLSLVEMLKEDIVLVDEGLVREEFILKVIIEFGGAPAESNI